jgi:hypothetical protein
MLRSRPVLVILILAVPVLLAALLVRSALSRPEPLTFSPGPPPAASDIAAGNLVTVTIDARDAATWRFLSLSDGIARTSPGAGWDLAFRRFNIIANGGPGFPGSAAIATLGEVPLETVKIGVNLPFVSTAVVRGDSVNPAIARWYTYGFTSHLLSPLPSTWAVRTTDGRLALLRILGYYCPGPTPGCLTIRYRMTSLTPSPRARARASPFTLPDSVEGIDPPPRTRITTWGYSARTIAMNHRHEPSP